MATIRVQNEYRDMLEKLRLELAEIEPQYIALVDAIKGLEKLVKVKEQQIFENLPTRKINEVFGVSDGSFDGMENKEAALKCVYLLDRLADTRTIVDVLESAGFQHNSTNLWNTINTTLVRLQQQGRISREEKLWYMTDDQKKDYVANDFSTFFDHLEKPPAG